MGGSMGKRETLVCATDSSEYAWLAASKMTAARTLGVSWKAVDDAVEGGLRICGRLFLDEAIEGAGYMAWDELPDVSAAVGMVNRAAEQTRRAARSGGFAAVKAP